MHLIIALRLFNQPHAKAGIEQLDQSGNRLGHLIDTHVDRLYPALKNIIGYHQERGSLPPLRSGEVLEEDEKGNYRIVRTANCRLYWCLIETERPIAFWAARPEVELAIPHDQLQRFSLSIRGRVGAQYLDACDEFAEQLVPNSHRPIRYAPPSRRGNNEWPDVALDKIT